MFIIQLVYMSSSKFYDNLKNLYTKTTYFQKYGGDLWLCFILVSLISGLTVYFDISGKLNSIKPVWNQNKCNPKYMPFASIMNNDKSISALEFTEKNFVSCIGDVIVEIMKALLQPILLAISMAEQALLAIVAIFDEFGVAIAAMIKFILALLSKIMQILSNIINVIENFFADLSSLNTSVMAVTSVFSHIAHSFMSAGSSVIATVLRVLMNITIDVIVISSGLIADAVYELLTGVGEEVGGTAEEAAGAAEEALPFGVGIVPGIATIAAGIATFISGSITIIMGVIALVAGIVLLILAIWFMCILIAFMKGLMYPLFDLTDSLLI